MTFNKVHFVSNNAEARTPLEFYQKLNDEFHFNFDPCPSKPTFDGLCIDWKERNFINPPYGRALPLWIAKAYFEHLKGKLCVLLIPARTDTKWWHEYIMKANEIRFIKGRLKFQGYENSAPFPSCIVVFKPKK